MMGPDAPVLNRLGAKNTALITYRNQWWRLFTPMLLHAGFIHYAVNVIIQLKFGLMCEIEWGMPLYASIYLGSGLFSAILSCIALPDSLSVGSSGALMGLMGAKLSEIVCCWSSVPQEEISQR